MTYVNYSLYRRALQRDMTDPIHHQTHAARQTLEYLLEERRAALRFLVEVLPITELSNPERLEAVYINLRDSFQDLGGGFSSLALLDSTGGEIARTGPALERRESEAGPPKLHEADKMDGNFISDVFWGQDNRPHFVIEVIQQNSDTKNATLRATINIELLTQHLGTFSQNLICDAFLINKDGILQTPSQLFGDILDRIPFETPKPDKETRVMQPLAEMECADILAYANIDNSPFILMVLGNSSSSGQNWFISRKYLVAFLTISILILLFFISATSTYMVSHIRESDRKRRAYYHQLEYENKMASIGRLSAGVAHEINNPLAIINEKAGLAKDLLLLSDDFPQRSRIVDFADSILSSVERCGTITKRLLGFAKHMEIESIEIDLKALVQDVLSFLEKEAGFRNLEVHVHAQSPLPPIQSDRGQLQQVFLNIINNAFQAVMDGGTIEIDLRQEDPETVAVAITDTGCGIPEENVERIFEPFFTTKEQYGTGLGLSITYGIVQKLGGRITVESQLGKETRFTVYLPIRHASPRKT